AAYENVTNAGHQDGGIHSGGHAPLEIVHLARVSARQPFVKERRFGIRLAGSDSYADESERACELFNRGCRDSGHPLNPSNSSTGREFKTRSFSIQPR